MSLDPTVSMAPSCLPEAEVMLGSSGSRPPRRRRVLMECLVVWVSASYASTSA
ncbi:hypothetical protein AHiyo8_pI68290 (plasmid) [Arthrobacter sp. Hiyo8]|nr:hypothetical protein AHiyo8_pI68290 [Arthrobacter sp. Hiyo8]